MKLQLYKNIVRDIKKQSLKKTECIMHLQAKYKNIPEDTFISIYSQFHQRKIKKWYHRHHRKENIVKYYQRYTASVTKGEIEGFLLRLADEVDFPPTLIARIILEQKFMDTLFKETGIVPKGFVSKCIKDPSEITEPTLFREVELCILNDDHCGPNVEKIKREIGIQYEKLLHDTLTDQNIPHSDEELLRREGYDKTPDFKLVVPLVVNNHVIHWIESKASFGDEESHSAYLENQFWSYANRFGPGLVIYWFGFIDELDVNIERGIMLSDKFPQEIITLESILDEEEEDFTLKF